MRKTLEIENCQISTNVEVVEIIDDILITSKMIEYIFTASMSLSYKTASVLIHVGSNNKNIRLLFLFDKIDPRNQSICYCDFNTVEIATWQDNKYKVEKCTKNMKEIRELVMQFLALN